MSAPILDPDLGAQLDQELARFGEQLDRLVARAARSIRQRGADPAVLVAVRAEEMDEAVLTGTVAVATVTTLLSVAIVRLAQQEQPGQVTP